MYDIVYDGYNFVFNFVTDSPDIQNDQRRIEHIESLRGVLQDILTVDLLPDESDFVAIYGRVGFYIFKCILYLKSVISIH